ncbi:HpcH/HpaI aldolase/citrate lyase family protein [Pseudarthrobacter sp. J1738]|uniref:HpcH/HpaI aldolase/citrate lyase family protein n=1 Tax=unclassified Pseudarthrobacter TaxID=2647000 RepID=UPI003D29AEF6
MTFTMGPSLLFCPADRADRYNKAAERADAVILDLEDAVAAGDKEAARAELLAHVRSGAPLEAERTIVRVNPCGTEEFAKDLSVLAGTPYRTIMVAKAEDPAQIAELKDFRVIALCETASGIINAPAIAALPHVVALMWGAEDLVASLGGTSSRKADGSYRHVAQHARSQVLLAAGAYGKSAIDAVYVNIADLAGLAAESEDAVASGFFAKACIHPSQAGTIRNAYAPSADSIAEARALLAAAAEAGSGVFQYQGKMIDEPILKHAQATLLRAGEL